MTGFRASGALCVIVLTYVRPLEEVDAQMKSHVAWLEDGFAERRLLVAGRQEPRKGGVLLFAGSRADAERHAATDPFITSGVATAEVIAFNASFAQTALADLIA